MVWRVICTARESAGIFLVINLTLLILLAFSFASIDRNSGAFVAAVLGTVVIMTSSTIFITVLVKCRPAS